MKKFSNDYKISLHRVTNKKYEAGRGAHESGVM